MVLVVLGRPSVSRLWTPIQFLHATQNHKEQFLRSLCFGHWRKETVFLGYVCTQNSGLFVLKDFHLLWLHVSISALALHKDFVFSLSPCVQVCVSLCVCVCDWGSYRTSLLIVFSTVAEEGRGATSIILFDSWEQGQLGDSVQQSVKTNSMWICE